VENALLVTEGGRVVEVRRSPSVADRSSVVDLGDVVVVPGFVNAHCHLDYTAFRGTILQPSSFTAWIRRINEMKRTQSESDYITSITTGIAESLRHGVTTMVNISSFPWLVDRVEGCAPVKIHWCAELLDIRAESSTSEVLEKNLKALPDACQRGVSPHAPYTASADLYRAAASTALPLTSHIAESLEEFLMFSEHSGELYDFISSFGRALPSRPCSPLQAVAEFLSPGCMLAHMNFLGPGDLEILAAHRHFVAHCPRTHSYFNRQPFPYAEYRQAGVPVCLGTDSLASNASLSMAAEMRAFAKSFPGTPPHELLEMATVSGGRVLDSNGLLGSLCAGAPADFAAFSYACGDPLESLFEPSASPVSVAVGGKLSFPS